MASPPRVLALAVTASSAAAWLWLWWFNRRRRRASAGGSDRADSCGDADKSGSENKSSAAKGGRRRVLTGQGSGPARPLADTGLEDEIVFEFDVREFDFRGCLEEMLELERGAPLHLLHTACDAESYMESVKSTQFSAKKRVALAVDTNTWPAAPGRKDNPYLRRWKRVWSGHSDAEARDSAKVAARRKFELVLLRFARDFCAPRMGGTPCLFQREPTLRVVFPSPFATGRPHTDSEYHHQPSEVNWWLPISDRVFDNNSLYVESEPGRRDFHPLNLRYGQVCRFYGNKW